MADVISSGITGGFEFDELSDGSFVVHEVITAGKGRRAQQYTSRRPFLTREVMMGWIDEQRRKKIKAERAKRA